MAEFPEWIRGRHALAYFPLAYVSSKYMACKFTLTRLCRELLHILFSPDSFNLELTGVRLVHAGSEYIARCMYSVTLCDEAAVRALLSVKGASGKKPCAKCKNVIGRVDYATFHDDYLVYACSPDEHRLDHHTPASFAEMAGKLGDASGTLPAGRFEELEKMFGLNYVEGGGQCTIPIVSG